MRQPSRHQLLLLLGLVAFLGVELSPISLGRGATYVTETELALEPGSVLLGDPVVMTARVWSPQTMLIPRGDVTFEDATNGAFHVTRALNTTGYANYTWLVPPTYPPGNITIHARYGGSDWFDPSEAFEPLIIDDGLFTTTTELVLSATSLFPGETVAMAAAVQSSETLSIPQGEVLFEDATNGAFHETVPLDAEGNASCSWTVPTAYPSGTITLRASYSGSAEFAASEAVESLNIASPFSTATELTLAPDPVAVGDSVHMAALVWSPETTWIPTGTVWFYLLNESLLLGETTLNGTGHATTDWVVPVSWAGYMGSTVTIYAEYGGDTYFAISNTTSPLTIEETTYPTATTLTLSPNAATPGSSIALEAQVTAPQTALIPTGSVSFVDVTNAKALGTGALDATGRAHLLWTIPSSQHPGNLDIRANYLGDAAGLFSPSEAMKSLLVAPYSSTTTVTLSPI
ncbi:MAG: Ig-like domain-containing protein, partial [Thermodesulfobacteriota bacterium]